MDLVDRYRTFHPHIHFKSTQGILCDRSNQATSPRIQKIILTIISSIQFTKPEVNNTRSVPTYVEIKQRIWNNQSKESKEEAEKEREMRMKAWHGNAHERQRRYRDLQGKPAVVSVYRKDKEES